MSFVETLHLTEYCSVFFVFLSNKSQPRCIIPVHEAGDPPQAELAQGRAHPGRELRTAAVDGQGARARHRLRGSEVPEHRRMLGRGRRHGYGDDNDHGRHLHKGVQVREAARERVYFEVSSFVFIALGGLGFALRA